MPYPPPQFPVNNGKDFTKIARHDTYAAIDPLKVSDHSSHYVLITGCSKGLGRATAISLAKAGVAGLAIGARSDLDSAEADIVAAAKSAGKEVPKILKLKLDVTKWDDVEAAAKATENEFARLDILINNAGYLSPFEKIAGSDKERYWMNYEINVKGTYLMSKAFVPILLKGGAKTIINLTSAGAHGIKAGASGYQTTKFAILRFTEYLMAEYGDDGLLAYSVHPGGVPTEMGLTMPEEMHFVLSDTPELAGDTITFLVTKRREWLAGRYVSVGWDMDEFLSREEEIVQGDKLKMRMIF